MMKNEKAQIGLISVGAPWFNNEIANQNLAATHAFLADKWDVRGPEEMITDVAELPNIIQDFRAHPIQALVLQIGTFPDGEMPLALSENLEVPFIVHSLPEPNPEKSIELNSLCGANLTAYTLTEFDQPYTVVQGAPDDPTFQNILNTHLNAAVTLNTLKGSRLGLIGFRAPGFYPCVFDEILLRKQFGIGLDHIALSDITQELATAAPKTAPHETFPTIEGGILPPEAVEMMERYYSALTTVLARGNQAVFAIKDWPEIMGLDDPGGIWPALGWLLDDGFLLAPEGDVNSAVTMLMLKRISGNTPFFTDVSVLDAEQSTFLLWHYGGAPSLASDPAEIRFGAEGREVQFTIKSGPVTLAKIGMHRGAFRILAFSAEVLPDKVTLRRAGAKIKTTNTPAAEIMEHILNHGWEHHYCLVHGDVLAELKVFARLAGIPLEIM
jgi:L-fucose isomerase-like protein